MRYNCNLLERGALSAKVEEVLECRALDINSFIINSEVLFSTVYDFMFKVIDIKVVKHNNKLYTINSVDEDRWVEPLFIQLGDDGSLMDYFLLEFIKTTELDLEEYFINYIDFSEIMEAVRIKNSVMYNNDDEEDDDVSDEVSDPFSGSNFWN